jgi:hypothetical protein
MPIFDGGASRMQGIFNAGLLLFHFAFGRRTDVDLGHTAGQLGQALFQLFTVVIAGRVLDLAADLVDASLDVSCSCQPLR